LDSACETTPESIGNIWTGQYPCNIFIIVCDIEGNEKVNEEEKDSKLNQKMELCKIRK